MKKITSLILAIAMTLVLGIPTLAATPVTPTPPDWVTNVDEYLILPGDSVYEPENWDIILTLRADAAAGNQPPIEGDPLFDVWNSGDSSDISPAFRYELGLIGMKYAEYSNDQRRTYQAYRCFSASTSEMYYTEEGDVTPTSDEFYLLQLWSLRAKLVSCTPRSNQRFSGPDLQELLELSGYTMEQFLDYPLLSVVSQAEWDEINAGTERYNNRVEIWIDNHRLMVYSVYHIDPAKCFSEPAPVIVNGRTMVPIAWIAERLSADVSWVPETQSARLSRAGDVIDMSIGKTTAYRNGVPFEMEVAPFVTQDRTMIPLSYVAEFFGQSVVWNAEARRVDITEDQTVSGDSNMNRWALPMGAIISHDKAYKFGDLLRTRDYDYGGHWNGTEMNARDYCRTTLSEGWGINGRAELIETVCSMTVSGHNTNFLATAAAIDSLTSREYKELMANASDIDSYMFPFTKDLDKKWGDRGIIAWDLYRMSNLVQWGYTAGYLSYIEALALLEPAATILSENFDSWDEATENYVDGYNWWSRTDVDGKEPFETSRGQRYIRFLNTEEGPQVFDDSLFKEGVIGISDITAAQLLASVI